MNLECELAATKSRFAHECDDVDRIMATLGIMTPRTECGSLRVNDIMRHIQETLDALAASHSASVAFSDKYARAQRELAAYKHVMDTLRDSPCKYPPWRDAREVVEWIERRVAVLLAANA